MTALVREFIREAYKHPLFTLLLAVTLGVWITFSWSYFATAHELQTFRATTAEELAKLGNELESMQTENKIARLEDQIQRYESQIFDLERFVDTGQPRERDYNRLSELKTMLGATKRELARIQ